MTHSKLNKPLIDLALSELGDIVINGLSKNAEERKKQIQQIKEVVNNSSENLKFLKLLIRNNK